MADPGFEAIDGALLPSVSLALDTLLDSAALARPGRDAEAHAEQLRRLASELETLGRLFETLREPPAQPAGRAAACRARISA